MKAILSDIDANLEALQAVLQDLARFTVESIYCLGDVVGYGPDPRECLELAMAWPVVLLGNQDERVLAGQDDADGPGGARWTRRQLGGPGEDRSAGARRLRFLAERPRLIREGDLLFVHGSPRDPLHEYVFPEDVYNRRKMGAIFAPVERCCFMGHTHVPGIFVAEQEFFTPEQLDGIYRLDGRKTLCNVGSVGQPRDGDWRACYVLFDGNIIYYRRVEYDIDTTVWKIRGGPDRGT